MLHLASCTFLLTLCRTPHPHYDALPACAPRLQVLVVANPANTNALILKENAPSIPAGEPFTELACLIGSEPMTDSRWARPPSPPARR